MFKIYRVSVSIIIMSLMSLGGIAWAAVEEQDTAFDRETNAIKILAFGRPVLPTGAGPSVVEPPTDIIEPALDPRGEIGTSSAVSVTPAGCSAGDFNCDGSVNAADYVVWRKQDGSQAGYNEWRSNFGN